MNRSQIEELDTEATSTERLYSLCPQLPTPSPLLAPLLRLLPLFFQLFPKGEEVVSGDVPQNDRGSLFSGLSFITFNIAFSVAFPFTIVTNITIATTTHYQTRGDSGA